MTLKYSGIQFNISKQEQKIKLKLYARNCVAVPWRCFPILFCLINDFFSITVDQLNKNFS